MAEERMDVHEIIFHSAFSVLALFIFIPLVKAQFDATILQQAFQGGVMQFVIWFLLFFSVIFFAAEMIFKSNRPTAAIFALAFSLMGIYGMYNNYPNLMQESGKYALWILGAAVLLLILGWFFKGNRKVNINLQGFKMSPLFIGIAYLILWYIEKFTVVLPSVTNALVNQQQVLDVIAIAVGALVVMYGIAQFKSKMPMIQSKGNANAANYTYT